MSQTIFASIYFNSEHKFIKCRLCKFLSRYGYFNMGYIGYCTKNKEYVNNDDGCTFGKYQENNFSEPIKNF